MASTARLRPDLFGRLVNAAITAGQQRAPSIEAKAAAGRDPYFAAAQAMRAILPDDPGTFEAAMNRFVALMDLYTRDRLKPWVRPGSRDRNTSKLHPALVHVAAEMKLNKNGRFPERRFLAAVADMARNYPDWDEST